ncbi:MAG TPA: metalloregulator ArsR/SmtB family transcription factor [Afifellaceae bacterium]|nr:metalloregulator ArsR/SmtB family transcription factor [Afifellaceae bacterium]
MIIEQKDDSGIGQLEAEAARVAGVLKLLANESRLLILCRLAIAGEMSVGELSETIGLSQSALSQHLSKLRADGLVDFRRQSQTLFYRLADDQAGQLLSALKDIYCPNIT